MFDFLKKNKKPDPIFSVLGTDMHCHLVPCVDDGSKSLEETIECINTMYEVGYRRMYITPHFQFPRFPNKEDVITRLFEELREKLKESGVPMELVGVGGEYRIDDSFAKRLENPNFLRVGDKVLVELSLNQLRMGVEETLFELSMQDYEIILAHPERYSYYNQHSETLSQLYEQGVHFQVNVLSISGFYGPTAQEKAIQYIKKGWVDYLGTDMHNTMYAAALRDATKNKKVRKILEEYKFKNCEL